MDANPPHYAPSRDDLLAEVAALRQRVTTLERDKQDLEVMLEMATDHADAVSEVLRQERDDLEVMLEMTTDHADAVEEELHQKTEEALRRSERQLRMIVTATPVPVLISRVSDGAILYANHMAGALLGLSEETLLGRRLPEFAQQPAEWQHLLDQVQGAGSVDAYEMQIQTAARTSVWVAVALRPLAFDDVASMLATLYDITERKQREQHLQQQVQALRIEIDQSKKARQVAEVTESDYFRRLQHEARTLRSRGTSRRALPAASEGKDDVSGPGRLAGTPVDA